MSYSSAGTPIGTLDAGFLLTVLLSWQGQPNFWGAQAPQSSEDGEMAGGQMELRIRAWH